MTGRLWDEIVGEGPLVAVAVHDGHEVRDDVLRELLLDDAVRLREEDPWTGSWTVAAPTRLIGRRSRFEVDLNRPRDHAVYRTPKDAWGLEVWRSPPSPELIEESLSEYDAFYARLAEILDEKVARYSHFVVLDLHSYNHRRSGPDGEPAPAAENPQVNVGTGSIDRVKWGSVVDRFIADLRSFDFSDGSLDVRENVKFQGGHLVHWIHERYPGRGCAIAIEFKKFFMDEWTGEAQDPLVEAISSAVSWTAEGLRQELIGRSG